MDCKQAHEVTANEAKERLRCASRGIGPGAWTRRHPLEAVTISAILGYLASSDSASRSTLRKSIRFFLKMI